MRQPLTFQLTLRQGSYTVADWTQPVDPADLPYSRTFYCERCGIQYATLTTKHPFKPSPQRYIAVRGCCSHCPPVHSGAIPGSVWTSWDHEFLKHLPLPVLQREFDLHNEAKGALR